MPIYEFKCPDCGLIIEKLQGYEDPIPTCPEDVDEDDCGNPTSSAAVTFERTINAAHPRFTGSGFYETDYKGK